MERPADAGWTLVGGLDDRSPGRVDGGGAVAPAGAGWCLDWWVGAEDRWHFPSREASVRQARRGPGPVIETSLRVSSGDIASTAYPVSVGRWRAMAVEVSNRAKVPVSLALALRSIGLDGSVGHSHRLELLDERTVAVDAQAAVLLPRQPNEAGAALSDPDPDRPAPFPGGLTNGQPLRWDGPLAGVGAEAILIYPLPHGTSLRFTVIGPSDDLTERGSGRGSAVSSADHQGLLPERLPDADSVERGWRSVLERSCRLSFPDSGLTGLTDAARSRLLIEAPRLPDAVVGLRSGSGAVLSGLAAAGCEDECRATLLHAASTYPTALSDGAVSAAEVVTGLADAATLCNAGELTESLLEPTMAVVGLVERQGIPEATTRARLGLAALAELAGQDEAAAHLRSDLVPETVAKVADGRLGLETVMSLAQTATSTARWASPVDDTEPDSAEAAARFWMVARRLLIDRPLDPLAWTDADGLAVVEVLPAFPSAWLGGPVEVHDLAVAGARVSFAIRWHEYRPALLWEVGGEPVRLRCPGLDPNWSSVERTGEALLAGSPEDLPDAPAPGDSFA